MTIATTPAQLNRAYVQSKVIEANLEHLRVVLSGASPEITDTLRPIADSFGQYIRLLAQACALADASGRTAA